MGLDIDVAFDGSLGDLPLGNPFSRVKVAQLHVFAGDSDIHIQRFFREIHVNYE